MKLLSVLSALQAAALIFLASKVIELGRGETPSPAHSAVTTAAAARIDPIADERLRNIVREELEAWSAQTSPVTRAAQSTAKGEAHGLDRNRTVDQRARLELATRQLEQFKRQGQISPAEMQSYQAEMALLDPMARKRMLRDLVQAMNAGEIRGEL